MGSQGTVCAGGRYDALVEQLGDKAGCAVGFAMGIERLISLLEVTGAALTERPLDVYMICVGEKAELHGMKLAEDIRNQLPEIKLQMHCGGGSFKSQFKKADKSGAEFAIILGDEEIERAEVGVKTLRIQQNQQQMKENDIVRFLGDALSIQ